MKKVHFEDLGMDGRIKTYFKELSWMDVLDLSGSG